MADELHSVYNKSKTDVRVGGRLFRAKQTRTITMSSASQKLREIKRHKSLVLGGKPEPTAEKKEADEPTAEKTKADEPAAEETKSDEEAQCPYCDFTGTAKGLGTHVRLKHPDQYDDFKGAK